MINDGMILSGIFGLVLLIIMVFVIPVRLLKIITNQQLLIKIQSRTAISLNAVSKRKCVKCGDIHSPELIKNAYRCPHCDLNYHPNNVILKVGTLIGSYSKKFYEENKEREDVELLWKHN